MAGLMVIGHVGRAGAAL